MRSYRTFYDMKKELLRINRKQQKEQQQQGNRKATTIIRSKRKNKTK